jgi:hypothetical protein
LNAEEREWDLTYQLSFYLILYPFKLTLSAYKQSE